VRPREVDRTVMCTAYSVHKNSAVVKMNANGAVKGGTRNEELEGEYFEVFGVRSGSPVLV